MARRGRKRKLNARRRETTRELRQPPDRGTDELRAKRAMLAAGGDPNMTHCPLAILYTRGQIREPQYRAGMIYTVQYWAEYGKPFAKSGKYEQTISSGFDGDSFQDRPEEQERRAVFVSATRALHDAGLDAVREVKNVTAHQTFPTWLVFGQETNTTAPGLKDLMRGLTSLAEAYKCG